MVMQIEGLRDRFRKFGRQDIAEDLQKIIDDHPDLPPSLPKVIYTPVETVEEAKRVLEQFPALRNPENAWHWRTRQEEIAEYRDESVFLLVPIKTQLHAKVVQIFTEKGIHTRDDLVSIPPSDIPKLGSHTKFGETVVAKAISAIQVLAREDLANKSIKSASRKPWERFWRKG